MRRVLSYVPRSPEELDAASSVHLGERTPVGVRMADPPASIPENWMFCHTARHLRASVASQGADVGTPPEELRMRRVVERADGKSTVGEW